MQGFFDSLCGCFSPEVKRNILEYLSSASINRQVIEEEKFSEESEAPAESIYAQVKTKSYYFMKVKEDAEPLHEEPAEDGGEMFDDRMEPHYYPKGESTLSLSLYD